MSSSDSASPVYDAPLHTDYRPADPDNCPHIHPLWAFDVSPTRVEVRACTRMPLRGWLFLAAATALVVSFGVVLALVTDHDPVMITGAAVATPLALVGIWVPMFLTIRAAGPEPVLLILDRQTGQLKLPRAGVTTNMSQVSRIECVRYSTPNHRLDIIDSVLVVEPPDSAPLYILLERRHSCRLGRRVAKALDLPVVDYHIGTIAPLQQEGAPLHEKGRPR